MVVAFTGGLWSALCDVTGTREVFAAIEAALGSDLADEADRYRLRETIVSILKPWFAARDLKRVHYELDSAGVLWGRYRGTRDVVTAHRAGRHPILANATLPGGAGSITARSPLR